MAAETGRPNPQTGAVRRHSLNRKVSLFGLFQRSKHIWNGVGAEILHERLIKRVVGRPDLVNRWSR